MSNSNPCRDCDKRHVRCHGECPDYDDWNADHQAQLAEERKRKALDQKLIEAEMQRNFRTKHNKKRSFKR